MSRSTQKHRIKNVIGLLLTPFVLYGLLRFFEYVQVYRPRADLVRQPTEIHPQPEDVTFTSGDHYRCHGWFFPSLKQNEWSNWVLLISHGNGGNISYRLDLYELWLQEGFNVLAYDYRGYGHSSGRPSEQGTYEDVTAAYRLLREKGFAGERIVALGESLGGGVASELATQVPLGGLVLQSTFTSITALGTEWFPWLPTQTLGTIRYATQDKLPQVGVPLLVIHSKGDTMIPYHHAEQNFAIANDPKIFQEITGNHNDSLTFTANRYRTGIQAFQKLLQAREQSSH